MNNAMNNAMNNKAMDNGELLQKITEYGFALTDLALFLDTHPNDTDSIQTYNSLKEKYIAYKIEYARRYGPLTQTQVTSDNYWTWVSTPWPFEGGCR